MKKTTDEEILENSLEEERSFLNALRVITSPYSNYAWTNSAETFLNTYVSRFYLLILENKEVAITYSSLKMMRKIPILGGYGKQDIIDGLEKIGFNRKRVKLSDDIEELCWTRDLRAKEMAKIMPNISMAGTTPDKQSQVVFEKIKNALRSKQGKDGKIEDVYIEALSKYVAEKGWAKNFIEAEGLVKSAVSQL